MFHAGDLAVIIAGDDAGEVGRVEAATGDIVTLRTMAGRQVVVRAGHVTGLNAKGPGGCRGLFTEPSSLTVL